MHFRFIWHRSPPYLRGGPLPGILCGVPGVTLDRISKDFRIGLESWLFKILNILGRFLESKMESPNHFWLMIWEVFFDVAFCVDFYLFSDGSKPWKLSSRLGGSTIFTKSTFSKMVGKMLDLGCILGSQIDGKSLKLRCSKTTCFRTWFFSILCCFGLPKWSQTRMFCWSFSKTSIL